MFKILSHCLREEEMCFCWLEVNISVFQECLTVFVTSLAHFLGWFLNIVFVILVNGIFFCTIYSDLLLFVYVKATDGLKALLCYN